MTRIIIASSYGAQVEVEKTAFDNGFFPGYSYVRDAGGGASPYVPPWEDADLAAVVATPGSAVRTALDTAYAGQVTDAAVAGKVTSGTATQAALKAAIDAEVATLGTLSFDSNGVPVLTVVS